MGLRPRRPSEDILRCILEMTAGAGGQDKKEMLIYMLN